MGPFGAKYLISKYRNFHSSCLLYVAMLVMSLVLFQDIDDIVITYPSMIELMQDLKGISVF